MGRRNRKNVPVALIALFLLCYFIGTIYILENNKDAILSSTSNGVVKRSHFYKPKSETSGKRSSNGLQDRLVPKWDNDSEILQSVKLFSSSRQNPNPEISHTDQLPVSRIVHQILWTDTMTFRNYLSLLSVWKSLRPYIIMLYTSENFKPRKSEYDYNDWFDKVTSRIPHLQVQHLDTIDKMKYSAENEVKSALQVLKTGGIYVNINTVISSELWIQHDLDLQTLVEGNIPPGFIILVEGLNKTAQYLTGNKLNGKSSCVASDLFTGSEPCFTISKEVFPVDIMWINSSFGSFARELFYGSSNIPYPSRSFLPIPKLVHYVWFGSKDINYSMFLSFLSTQRFVKPIRIFIYVNRKTRPSSKYFDKITSYSNVEIIYYGRLKSVYQTPISGPSHQSDIVRADVLLRRGGIYIDFDVYWMKPVDDLVSQGYETIASLDFMKDMYPRQGFPDTINMGVVLARPGSRFIALWQESFKKYKGYHTTYHAVEMVYKLYEEHPDLLHIDRRLQIMCFKFKCHPLWLENYKNASADNSFEFRKDVYAVHFTKPIPEAFKSEEMVKTSSGFFGDMARHISGIP